MQNSSKMCLFYGGPFSQFYKTKFVIDAVEFCCAEQYMMYSKAVMFNDMQAAHEIMKEERPFMMQKWGRTVRNFDQSLWDVHKFAIVTKGNLAKFSRDTKLLQRLLSTGESVIAEASPYDKIWGIGLDVQKAKRTPVTEWPGLNLLGKALMDVRSKLRDR